MSSEPSAPRVPDGIEPIVAYRAWTASPNTDVLRSVTGVSAWRPGMWTEATCRRPGTDRHAAPAEGCTCGLYAIKDLDYLRRELELSLAGRRGRNAWNPIIGKVELAGVIVEHDHGYRAQLGRVMEILPTSGGRADAERIARAYGVPVGEEIRAPKASWLRYVAARLLHPGPLSVPRSRMSQVLLAVFVIALIALSVGSVVSGHVGSGFFSMWWAIRGGSSLVASRRRLAAPKPPRPQAPPPSPPSPPPQPPAGSG